ncbi:hypothetical protein CVT24_001484 [Panaeolus cyanescens]|uniref:Uncharacterized protein n=1 Tax=Panaeolus cyanescens TaxID=181874 RepID=A0A409VT95_9AGAR|nr:hypothetical protein CVT24_001484 [Panaeolus cyanescens]
MFSSGSPYSSFFTSGLMSSVVIPPVRRGSLPNTTTSEVYYTAHEDTLRSFLSLDLAESQSMRSASLKRKPTLQAYVFPRPRPTTLRSRFSKDSLRTIPSPKPAPSINLPDLPTNTSSPAPEAPPRLPSLPALPALELSLPTMSVSISRTHAPPAITTLKSSSSRLPPNSSFAKHRFSVATKATSSTVSTRVKTFNRSEALARLEGRSAAPVVPKQPSYLRSNFMSMSDDEDDDEIEFQLEDEDVNAHGNDEEDHESDLDSLDIELDDFPAPVDFLLDPILEPEDVVLPLQASSYLEAPRSAPLPPRRRLSPPPMTGSLTPNPSAVKRQRTVKRGSKDWFPLKSFIDLHADDERASSLKSKDSGSGATRSTASWSWRSFIEVANVV